MALHAERLEPRPDRVRTARHDLVIHQSHFASALALQHPHEVGIGHWRKWMMLHPAFVERHVPDEQVTLEHRSLVVRKSGRGNREIGRRQKNEDPQGLRDRADVAFRRTSNVEQPEVD